MKSHAWYRRLYDAFERPSVFNLYQTLVDGGKGRQIRRFLADVPYRSLIDVGCGTGNWATLARGAYLGIDTSEAFIAGCRRRYAGDDRLRFVQADAATLALDAQYDLAILVSVLHHLPDEAVRRLLPWVAAHARHFFVLDLYPMPWNPPARLLYALDRGDYIRTPAEQKALLGSEPGLRLVREDDYFAPTGLYRHTLFLFESEAAL